MAPPLVVSRGADTAWEITLNVSDTVDMLDRISSDDASRIENRWHEREDLGLHPLGSWMQIDLQEVSGQSAASPPMQLVGRFLQQLFLAMNVAAPGSFNLFASRYSNAADTEYPPPNLSSDILEGAVAKAHERGWPALRRLPVADVWSWLQHGMSYDVDIATDDVDKVLFTVLRVCEPQEVDVDNVLHVAQALEALFASGRESIGSVVQQRLEAVLGEPTSHKRWFTRFYDVRSRIAHGSMPVLRPGRYYDIGESSAVEAFIAEFWQPIDQALAALLAVVQDMVAHRSRGYRFEQQAFRKSM